eukprot:s3738_g6.t1
MEKRSRDETATLRRKKRQRKVVASSSEEETKETSQVETKKLEEDVSNPNGPNGQENKDIDAGVAEVLGREPTLEPTLEPSLKPETEVPADASPAAPKPVAQPVEPELAEPVDEANQGRKRDNATKVLHAARAWLKAPSRKTDAVMLERCIAMSGLTKKEIADFVEANAKRRPGEWCFTVVDERIRAKKEEQEAIQAATGTVPAPAELGKPSSSQADEASAAHRGRRAKRLKADVASDCAAEASVPPVAAPAAPPVTAPVAAPVAPPVAAPATPAAAPPVAPSQSFATSAAAPEPQTADAKTCKPPEKNPPEVDPPALPAAPRRRGPKPRASKAVAAVPQASTACPELSCLDRLEATQSRRKFAPLRPGTRTVQSTATLTATAPKAAVQPPSRSGCRHPKVSKKDCAMVCDICGEELLYDGWRLELCDEFDVYNSATS